MEGLRDDRVHGEIQRQNPLHLLPFLSLEHRLRINGAGLEAQLRPCLLITEQWHGQPRSPLPPASYVCLIILD